MIAIGIILALSAAFIAGMIIYWKQIVEWIKKATNKIKEVLGITIQGIRTFVEKTIDSIKNISKYYNENKVTGAWEETVYTKVVSENEIPSDILEKIRATEMNTQISTTEELQLVLNQ